MLNIRPALTYQKYVTDDLIINLYMLARLVSIS